jgi:hypothetical protein
MFIAKIQTTSENFISEFGEAVLKCDWTDKEISLNEYHEKDTFDLSPVDLIAKKTVYKFTVSNLSG